MTKRSDIFIISAIVLVAIVFGVAVYKPNGDGSIAVVKYNDNLVISLPLIKDETYVFNLNGENTIVVENGECYVENADCRDNICVQHQAISQFSENIVCLPHGLVIEIQ